MTKSEIMRCVRDVTCMGIKQDKKGTYYVKWGALANDCWRRKATRHFVCIVEFRVMAKYVKMLSVVQQCFYGQMYVAVNNEAYVSLHVIMWRKKFGNAKYVLIIPDYYKRNRHFQCCIKTKLLMI